MRKFMKLYARQGVSVVVNLDHVVHMLEDSGAGGSQSRVTLSDGTIVHSTETVERITARIREYENTPSYNITVES